MSHLDRIPLCVLQGRLAALEQEIDASVAELGDYSSAALRWRHLHEPKDAHALVGVDCGLRDEYAILAAAVLKRQEKEYRLLREGARCVHCGKRLGIPFDPGFSYACTPCGSMDMSFNP